MPDPEASRQRELDAKVESLTRQIADVIKSAGSENRQDLREYALELLKEETEAGEPAARSAPPRRNAGSNPLGIALLVGAVGLPLLALFPPVGLAMLAVAVVLAAWGVLAVMFRRS